MNKTPRQKEIYKQLQWLNVLDRAETFGRYDFFDPRRQSKRHKRLLRECWAIEREKAANP